MHRADRALIRMQARAELPQRADITVGELWRRVDTRAGRAIEPHCQRLGDVIMVASDLGPEERYVGADTMLIEPVRPAAFTPTAGDIVRVGTGDAARVYEVIGRVIKSARRWPFLQRMVVRAFAGESVGGKVAGDRAARACQSSAGGAR